MPLPPIQWGPPVTADLSGVDAASRAVASHEQVYQNARQLGATIEGGAQAVAQSILHSQSLKATAAVKERQAATLQFIDSNPYVSREVLRQRMSPEDYAAWEAGAGGTPEWKDKPAVPMYIAAGPLFDSETKQARQEAGNLISLPGWRGDWDAAEREQSSVIRERYVNRMAADQMIADLRSSSLSAIDKMVDSAVVKSDLDIPIKAAETSPVLSPSERRVTSNKVRVARDSFDAEQAMLRTDVVGMKTELDKLRGPKAAEDFPNMTEKQRLDLSQRLERQYGFHAAKKIADDIVGKFVDEQGKVDRVGIAKAVAAYDGPNREEVVKAANLQEQERLHIFDSQSSDIQETVFTAGQNPKTGEFSMARARMNPDAAKAADWLNKNAPGKLDALAQRDLRRQRYEDTQDRMTAAREKMEHIQQSHDNLSRVRDLIYDEKNADTLRGLTPSQWDSQLHEIPGGLTDEDMDKARKDFAAFQKRGGKPDERAQASVAAEVKAAANGDQARIRQLSAKYGDVLLRAAHEFIRDNASLAPAALTEGVRGAVKAELLQGAVIGGGHFVGDANDVRRADWETNPRFAGKDFKASDGTVIGHERQPPVRLTRGGVTMDFRPENAADARADGWK
jgi:hypothetical protein